MWVVFLMDKQAECSTFASRFKNNFVAISSTKDVIFTCITNGNKQLAKLLMAIS